jgi:hypothetical protein
MPNPVVELAAKALARFRKFHQDKSEFFPEQQNLYPIPFFGDIRDATVLTLALNPAWTEFRHNRHWLPGLDAFSLTTRLLHYFDLPAPPPHRWFRDRHDALALLECSYETNTAHIDLHPLPIKFRPDLTEVQRNNIGHLIETRSQPHLANLLKLAKHAKLLLVVDYTFSKSNGATTKTSDFIQAHQPIAELLCSKGNQLQVFMAGGTNDFKQRIAEHRDALRKHLRRTS